MKSLKAALGIGVHRRSHSKQKGVATILVILMIGVGVVAVSVGTLHTMRNTQERQLVAQSQVNAQAGAWAAVEAVRKVLGTLNSQQLAALTENSTWVINPGIEKLALSALIKSVELPSGTAVDYKVTAEVSAVAEVGQSSSTIEVVYAVTPAGGDGSINLSGVLDFYNDLKTTGGITLEAQGQQGLDFNVDGDFTATSAGISGSGFRNISVTGNISLDSQVAADVIRGRNIKLIQSATAVRAEAWGLPSGEQGSTGSETSGKGFTCCGNITIESYPKADQPSRVVVGTAHANGNVVSKGAVVTNILARRDVDISGEGSDDVTAVGNVSITNWTAKLLNVFTGGNFTKSGGVGSTGSVFSVAGVADCPSGLDSQKNQTIKIKSAANLRANCQGTVDAAITVPQVDKVAEVKLKAPVVDAHQLKAGANYAVEFTTDGKVKVTVKNVNGIANDIYYLGNYGRRQLHLCKAVTLDANGKSVCDTSATPEANAMPFCINRDADTECITYDSANKIFSIKADSIPAAMPAGVIWVDGTIRLAGGPFFNTFIATRNIETYGALTLYSVNYGSDYDINGSSDAVCKNQRGTSTFAVYTARYPSNFCSNTLAFQAQTIGNIGLLAGSFDPASPQTYVGGNINLTASTTIYGTVVAGNILDTSGATTVYGYITAAGLSQSKTDANDLIAKLTVDLTKRPAAYNPDKVPNTDTSGGGSTLPESKVLWTRYL